MASRRGSDLGGLESSRLRPDEHLGVVAAPLEKALDEALALACRRERLDTATRRWAVDECLGQALEAVDVVLIPREDVALLPGAVFTGSWERHPCPARIPIDNWGRGLARDRQENPLSSQYTKISKH